MQALARWVLGPIWQGVATVALCYALSLFDFIAIVIQAFITLRQGATKGFVVSTAGPILGIPLGYLLSSLFFDNASFALAKDALLWALLLALPLWAFACLLRRTVSLALTTQIITVVMVILFAVTYGANFSVLPQSYNQAIDESVNKLTTMVVAAQNDTDKTKQVVAGTQSADGDKNNLNNNLNPTQIAQLNNFMTHLFEVVVLYIAYLMFLLLARMWQSAVFMPKEFMKEFTNIRSGALITSVFISFWALELMASNSGLLYLFGGVLFILAIWLLFNGFAFVHWVMAKYQWSWTAIMIFYLLLLVPLIANLLLLGLILIGLVDGLKDLRGLALRIVRIDKPL